MLTGPGAFVLMVALIVIGLMFAFAMRPSQMAKPVTDTAKWLGGAAASTLQREQGRPQGQAERGDTPGRQRTRRSGTAVAPGTIRRSNRVWGENGEPRELHPGRSRARRRPPRRSPRPGGGRAATAARPDRPHDDITEAGDSAPTREQAECRLPETAILDDIPMPDQRHRRGNDHRHNEEIIKKKLAGFGIPAEITGAARAGGDPVRGPAGAGHQGQRIEALADDLAMALAAARCGSRRRSGQERGRHRDPNKDFNIVALRRSSTSSTSRPARS